MTKISQTFFQRDVLSVAPELLGKILVRKYDDGHEERFRIEDDGTTPDYVTTPRIGIDYAKEWKNKPWRYVVK